MGFIPVNGRRMASNRGMVGIGLFVVVSAMTVSLFSFVLALPPFRFGIWHQSEPAIAAMHFVSGIAALGLALTAAGDRRFAVMIVHPFVIMPLAVAIWALISGLFHRFPMMGWFGTPQIGEGLLWFLDIAVLTAASIVIARFRRLRLILLSGGLIVVLFIGGVTFYREFVFKTSFAPFYFPDYTAFYGIFIFPVMIVFSGFSGRRGKDLTRLVAASLVSGVIIYMSTNWAAYMLAFFAAPIVWIILSRIGMTLGRRRALAVFGSALVPIVVTAVVIAFNPDSLSGLPQKIAALANSVLSRHNLAVIVIDEVKSNPISGLVGNGWGSFSDLLAIHLPVEWTMLWQGQSIVGKTWDSVLRVDFHSHDYLIEALVGGGIISVVLVLSITALLPLWCRRRYLPMAGVVAVVTGGVSAFWFQMPISLPFMAMAWGALAGPSTLSRRVRPYRKAVVAGLIVIGLFLAYWGADSWTFSRRAYYFQPSMEAPLYGPDGRRNPCPETIDDRGRGGVHLAQRLRTYTSFIVRRITAKDGPKLNNLYVKYLRGLICASEDYLDHGASFRLMVASLSARADLSVAPSNQLLDKLRAEFLGNWGQRLDEVLRRAPKRTDLAAAYLMWLVNTGQNAKATALAARIHERNLKDPVGLWFYGIALLADGRRKEEGLVMMRQGIKAGIERIMPLDDALKRQIMP